MAARIMQMTVVMAALVLGLWGCAQGTPGSTGQAEEVRQLKAKTGRLETACKEAETARDQAARELAALKEDAGRMKKSLEIQKNALAERDALRLEIDARIAERDLLKGRCETLKSGLQGLIKQCDAGPSLPPITAAPVKPANRS
jgi:hypothetical protein